jgi:mannose-6-phosphate isomerase-like protein (cupin superfamily)
MHEADDVAKASEPVVVNFRTAAFGSGGAVWSLPHGGDLDANLVCLDAGGEIGAHVNNEVDVLMFVRSGNGSVTVDGETVPLGSDHLAWIPKGARRSVTAGSDGISYLSVHRQRGGLGITPRLI